MQMNKVVISTKSLSRFTGRNLLGFITGVGQISDATNGVFDFRRTYLPYNSKARKSLILSPILARFLQVSTFLYVVQHTVHHSKLLL